MVNQLKIKILKKAPKKNVLFIPSEFNLEQGKINFLIGENGIGKSTIFYNLAQVKSNVKLNFFENEIKFKKAQIKYFHKQTHLIFQNPKNQLVGKTVREELMLSHKINDLKEQEIFTYLKYLKLDVNILDQVSWDLSFGQMRKILLLDVLLSDNKFLLLDEPGNNLDYESQFEFFNLIKKISDKKYVLIISHDSNLVNHFADNIFTIQNQKIIKLENNKFTNQLDNSWKSLQESIEEKLTINEMEFFRKIWNS